MNAPIAVALASVLCLAACEGSPQRGGDGGLTDAGREEGGGPPGEAGLLGDSRLADGARRDGGPRPPDAAPIDPTKDSDGDGLPDGFEQLFGLNPTKKDSDGDGVPDGQEDDDKDGLTAQQEWGFYRVPATAENARPSPTHRDLVIELDYQKGFGPSPTLLAEFVEAYAAVDLANPDGKPGIAAHVYVDERDLPVSNLAADVNARMDYLGAHGPGASLSSVAHAEMVHVMLVAERPDSAARGGETVGSTQAGPNKAGVLIYSGNLQKLFPTCNLPNPPAVSLEEALVSTFVHEVGHTLQLGHDTDVGGGVNAYNIMATDLKECALLKQRTRGTGNSDPALGATDAQGGPRFSRAAAQLMKLTNKISAEASQFETGSGHEM